MFHYNIPVHYLDTTVLKYDITMSIVVAGFYYDVTELNFDMTMHNCATTMGTVASQCSIVLSQCPTLTLQSSTVGSHGDLSCTIRMLGRRFHPDAD